MSVASSGPASATQNVKKGNGLRIVLPGDCVTPFLSDPHYDASQNDSSSSPSLPKIGHGLRLDAEQVYATKAGRLRVTRNLAYVQTNASRYAPPKMEDRVIGIVEDRVGTDPSTGGDLYRVNVNASHPALLNSLDFEGASKRNKPRFQPSQVVYARIKSVSPHVGLQLSCQLGPHDGNLPRKDWMTNEGMYGLLHGGTLTKLPTGLCHELLQPDNVVLRELAAHKELAFEVAVGVNGMLWVHSCHSAHTILVQHAILNSQVLTEAQTISMVKSLVYTVQKALQKQIDQVELDSDTQMEE